MKAYNLKINTKTKRYCIFVGSNLIPNINRILASQKLSFSKILIVVDRNIPIKLRKKLIGNIKTDLKKIYIFNPSERNKCQKTVVNIQNILFKNRFNRDDCLIAFGGGITGDVAAYSASTFKRGIKFVNIPTTLLAQVDSSVGGKTGINNSYGKNLIGSFYQPDAVVSDIDLLKSLKTREIICGYAEILKSSLLESYKSFNYLDKNINNILNLKEPYISRAILMSCNLKKEIVQKDENEKNLRKVLNLGHTFAHAYESCLGFTKKLNHGEAVIIGIKNAIEFSKKQNLINDKSYKLIKNHINKIPLNKSFKSLFKKRDINKIIFFMKSDKKNSSTKINLILFKNFGKIKTNFQISELPLKKFLNSELNN
tara:strand:- start:22 stop:1128 length:1107 start_codon:yes stop_codon:yes gene_type:complete